MVDLLGFKCVQIVSVRMTCACVRKTAELFGITRSTVSKVTTAFEQKEKNVLTEAKLGKKAKAV